MDKITKLSQAIRLGSTFRPQCQFHLFMGGRSCALGAALEAVTGEYLEPDQINSDSLAPLCERFGADGVTFSEISFQNDQCGMTREQIADWLEGQGL